MMGASPAVQLKSLARGLARSFAFAWTKVSRSEAHGKVTNLQLGGSVASVVSGRRLGSRNVTNPPDRRVAATTEARHHD